MQIDKVVPTQGHSIIQVNHLSWTFGDQHLGLSTYILHYRPTSWIIDRKSKIFDAWCTINRKSWIIKLTIQDFRFVLHLASKIQDFQSIIQVYQLDFEFWIIKLKNLDSRFDKPRFSICCTFGVENLGLSSDNPSFLITYRKSWIIN